MRTQIKYSFNPVFLVVCTSLRRQREDMKGMFLRSIIVVLLQLSLCREQNPCSDTVGIIMVAGAQCGHFHACYSGSVYRTVRCSEGMALDSTTQRCTVDAFNTCIATMTNTFECPKDLKEAFYPDYSLGCPTKSFYTCKYGKIESKQCQTGTFYNEGTDMCESAAPSCSNIICDTATAFAMYADYSDGCPTERFFVCLSGTMFSNTCPAGLFYNEGVKNCDHSRNIPCAQNVRQIKGA